jgi:hypothetical protein
MANAKQFDSQLSQSSNQPLSKEVQGIDYKLIYTVIIRAIIRRHTATEGGQNEAIHNARRPLRRTRD